MIRALATVLAGELRLQLRQPLALLVLLVMPIALVPGALVAMELYLSSLDRATASGGSGGGEGPELVIAATEPFASWVEPADRLLLSPDARVPLQGEPGEADALAEVSVEGSDVRVRYRVDLSRSRSALERVNAVTSRHSAEERDRALRDAGVSVSADEVLAVTEVDHAEASRRGGDRIGSVLPPLLLFALVVAAVYTALDVVSGEKERGTIETLLVTAVDRRAVVLAKGLVTVGAAVVAGWIGLGSLGLLGGLGLVDLPTVLGDEGMGALTLVPLLWVGVAVGLLAVQAAGVSLVLAAWAPDYRTGSMLSGPAMLLLIAPSSLAAMPGISLSVGLALVPVANVALACRELLAGDLAWGLGALTLVATAGHAAVAVAIAWRLLSRDESLIGVGDSGGRRALGFFGRDAAILYVLAVLLLWFFGQLAQSQDLVWGMVFTQVVLMAGLAVGGLGYLGLPLRDTLSLRTPRLRDAELAVAAGLLLPAVGQLVMVLQTPLIPNPEPFLVGLEGLTVDDQPVWVPLLVFAVLPGVCEELLFRGALLGLLRRSLPPVARVVVVAAAFGFLHLALPRLLPTAVLGLLLGVVVLRTGSLWPAMGMHALNNGVAVVLGRSGHGDVEPPLWVAAVGALAAVGLIAAMGRGRGRP